MALAHHDGTPMRTEKANFLRKLECLQNTEVDPDGQIDVEIYDGGSIIHSVLSRTASGTSYGQISRQILSSVCSGSAREVHLCLDRHDTNSIKKGERHLRGAEDRPHLITGAQQTTKQSGQQLLKNGIFKNELAKFLLIEWEKDGYGPLFRGKLIYASHGGKCTKFMYDSRLAEVSTFEPVDLQVDHEEADTLIAYHLSQIHRQHRSASVRY